MQKIRARFNEMARKRMLSPQFWDDPETGSMPPKTRLLFIGLISQADDEGRGEADARLFRKQVFGFDQETSVEEVDCLLDEIASSLRSVVLYEIGDRRYYALLNWKLYQTINRPSPSRIPPPPGIEPIPTELSKIGEVYQAWESLTGTIIPFHAQDLGAMIDEWDAHLKNLPSEHPNTKVSGAEAVKEAIQVTGRSASRPYNLNYVRAVIKNWMTDGYQAKKPSPGKMPKPESYTKDELAKVKGKKK